MTNREIDVLVAEKVMGLEPIWGVDLGTQPLFDASERLNSKGCLRPALPYSTSIEAAWEIIPMFDFFRVDYHPEYPTIDGIDGAWIVEICPIDNPSPLHCWIKHRDKTAPLAICKAALKAKGVDIA